MVRLQLELGGKDPTYVSDDVDPKAAAESLADGAMYNTGQSCCSVERIYVHERVHDAFVEHFVADRRRLQVWATRLDDGTYIGPLTRAPQLDVLEAQVADALAKGATLRRRRQARRARRATGSSRPCSPASNHTMAVMRDESFGPIIGIQKVASDDEALALMNDTRYGLTAGVYTRDEARAAKLLAPRQRRQRLLELLRPRQPAPAVVGPRRLRRRRDAVDLRHPGVHAAARLAPAVGVTRAAAACPPRAVRSRRHAARRRHRRALVRVPVDAGRPRSRDLRRRATATSTSATQRGTITPAEFAGFYAATLAGRSAGRVGAAARPIRRERDRRRASAPASHALVAQHRDAGDRLVLTTATNRFLTEPIAARARHRRV